MDNWEWRQTPLALRTLLCFHFAFAVRLVRARVQARCHRERR
jgi:hypothetical protein